MRRIIASSDPALHARVISSTPLLYRAGANMSLDRPAHVRAGSGLARIGNYFAVAQDDANFIALIDCESGEVSAIALPAGVAGRRQFDDRRGNKRFKMDLESCALVSHAADDWLVAFGSGASPSRERIAVLSDWTCGSPRVEIYDVSALYAALRATEEFSGSEMNIEGAVFVDGCIRLYGRGNGAARDGLVPLDATCDLDWTELCAHLSNPSTPPPVPMNIIQYDLGTFDGLRLGFTDAAINSRGGVFFSAAAENSPDATHDGWVAGSALGVFGSSGEVRWAVLQDTAGDRFKGKVEGLVFARELPYRAFVVLDQDDPSTPSKLCEIELSGKWYDD
ncbi:MAG: hypothetical protein M3R15_28530 [Acidobacteriota bacterium]|nr:hypothetical protein [Acidobacteriota bacterium]